LDVYAALLELRKEHFQLAITHQRITADNGEMNGTLAINDRQEPANEVVAFVVGQLAEIDACGSQMLGLIRVASRAAQGALTGDFDGKIWLAAV
jgi:hypothetical protein